MRPISIRLTELEVLAVKDEAMRQYPGYNETGAIHRWAQRIITEEANKRVVARHTSRPSTVTCTCHLEQRSANDTYKLATNPLCPIHGDPRDTNVLSDPEIGNRLADGIPGFERDSDPVYRRDMRDSGRGGLLRG